MNKETESWVSLKQAAAHLGVSPSWLYQKGPLAQVPRVRIGNKYRYQLSELDSWVKNQGDA
jgi:predicted DNA-binding transcriptional regulator AlpA